MQYSGTPNLRPPFRGKIAVWNRIGMLSGLCSHMPISAIRLQGFSKLLEFTCDKCGRATILATHDGGG